MFFCMRLVQIFRLPTVFVDDKHTKLNKRMKKNLILCIKNNFVEYNININMKNYAD